MRIGRLGLIAILLVGLRQPAAGQVLPPSEIADPVIRGLQQSHLEDLQTIAAAIGGHTFPYHFSLSRRLDVSEREQAHSDQRSIQFERFHGQIVLKITGNYFAAYSAGSLTREERARRTYEDVLVPLLEAAVPALLRTEVPDSFALEVSHHVVKAVLGVDTESAENVALVLPKASAERLVVARDGADRDAVVTEGSAYLNGTPVSLASQLAPASVAANSRVRPAGIGGQAAEVASPLKEAALRRQDATYHDAVERIVKDLDAQAHFLPGARPSFISFRGAPYLQIPFITALGVSDAGSQYKLAALAFDRHVARLIRPVLAYFKDGADFAGIDFSSTVRLPGGAVGQEAVTVEFILPLTALRRYEQFNLTGQQLIDTGVVLINGERAGLDLQVAEATPSR
jgi:hypothetical protein